LVRDGAKGNSITFYGEDPFYPRGQDALNKELFGISPLQVMDEIIRYAGEIGLVIILDNHSRKHDKYMEEKLWYAESTSEKQWIEDWVLLANRYKNNPTVVGFDLNNEPHGKIQDGGATWAAGNLASDWNVLTPQYFVGIQK
jgi:endoglucanase